GIIFISFILLRAYTVKKDVKTTSEASVETKNEPSNKEISSEKTNSKYVDDRIINEFINSYNQNSNSPLENIKKGNIKIKYFASSYGYYLELLHANDTDKINVTINQTNENGESGVAGMKEVFHDIVKSIESSLSDDEINNYFDNLMSNEIKTGSNLGTLKIEYIPDKELSNGHSRGHIKVIAQ
ncbi:hypothetical protein, partial [Streptococcus sp.]|uniref:hypothetical protein n=1 Tax=Streptococcus sp. TaxID=1306 RepID=UPI0025D4519E